MSVLVGWIEGEPKPLDDRAISDELREFAGALDLAVRLFDLRFAEWLAWRTVEQDELRYELSSLPEADDHADRDRRFDHLKADLTNRARAEMFMGWQYPRAPEIEEIQGAITATLSAMRNNELSDYVRDYIPALRKLLKKRKEGEQLSPLETHSAAPIQQAVSADTR